MEDKKDIYYLAVDKSLFGERFKIYHSIEEAKEDRSFLYDKLYECKEI